MKLVKIFYQFVYSLRLSAPMNDFTIVHFYDCPLLQLSASTIVCFYDCPLLQLSASMIVHLTELMDICPKPPHPWVGNILNTNVLRDRICLPETYSWAYFASATMTMKN